MEKEFTTKDSGKRQDFNSGMRRDTQEGKPRFDLIIPEGQNFKDCLLYRWAMLMSRGAKKYNERNWEKAKSQEEMDRFKASAFRHFMQWVCNENDEDHVTGILFNLNAYEWLKKKIKCKK